MGKSAAETVREIEDIRDRIEGNFRELEQRMPRAGIWAKRALGLALTGMGILVIRGIVRAVRSRGDVGPDEDSWVLVRLGDLEKLNGEAVPVVLEED
ncbi:MAG: hypothetical protein ACRDI0_05825 [Actinomycetota bacterium]